MDSIRMLLLTGVMGALLTGALVAGAPSEHATPQLEGLEPVGAATVETEPEPESPRTEPSPGRSPERELTEPSFDPVLTVGVDLDDEGATLFPTAEDIVLANGLRIGPVAFDPSWESEAEAEEAAEEEAEEASERTSRAGRSTRRAPARPVGPRLHPDPGMHSVLTARRMMASNEVIQGSCYRYLSEVYARAGHRSWRKRRIVYREERDGPYADPSLIRPGDWLYIVNDPGRTPVGTHSVMFVRWTDRARGYASVISHPGWGAPSAGRERTYDVSRTYRIIRPTD